MAKIATRKSAHASERVKGIIMGQRRPSTHMTARAAVFFAFVSAGIMDDDFMPEVLGLDELMQQFPL